MVYLCFSFLKEATHVETHTIYPYPGSICYLCSCSRFLIQISVYYLFISYTFSIFALVKVYGGGFGRLFLLSHG